RFNRRHDCVVGICVGGGFHATLLLRPGTPTPAPGVVFDSRAQFDHGRHFNHVGGSQIMKRIGLIAMSGVRAHNEELTRLGLTLPGFVDRNRIIASLPSLGLLTLAGLTPPTFDVEYHEIADLKKLPELPTDFDLVAISTFTAQFYEACDVADYYRSHGVPVVMGGITVSSLVDQASEFCTSVVVGEG